MSTQKPYRLAIPYELHHFPDLSNVKIYGQFVGPDPQHAQSYLFRDRGFEFTVASSSGFSQTLIPQEYYRILGTLKKSEDAPLLVHANFDAIHAVLFDPDVFEKALRIRRDFEQNFERDVLQYSNPVVYLPRVPDTVAE